MAHRRSVLLVVTFASVITTAAAQDQKRVVGYFPSWGVYARDYHVPMIPADQLTHVYHAFANVVGGLCVVGDPWADTQMLYPGDVWGQPLAGSFHQLHLLRDRHPHLRILFAVGGWTWSSGFSDAVLTPAARRAFAASCVDFLIEYDFDGVDLENFTLFLAELRSQLDLAEAAQDREYLLTIAGGAAPEVIANYELELIYPHLDWINTEWIEQIDPNALGLDQKQKEAVNDDRMGRALDPLAEHGGRGIFFQLALRSIRLFVCHIHQRTSILQIP